MDNLKQKFEKIAQGVSEDILLIDNDFNILWANDNLLKKYKMELKDVINEKCYKITHGKNKRCGKLKETCPIEKILENGEPNTSTHEHYDKNGKKIFVEVTVYPLKDEKDNIIEFVHLQKDITEKMLIKRALEESEKKHRKLFENSIIGVGVSKGNKVHMANKALLNIFGYETLEEFTKIPLIEHVAPDYKDMIIERIIKREKGEYVSPTMTYRIIRKDGRLCDLEVSSSRIMIEGKQYTQTAFRDITEQKRYEENLKDSKKIIENEVKRKTKKIYKLNRELGEYAKRLDIKIKKIDERRIPLNQNEKLVFYGIVRYPELTSKELGKKIGVHTSTVNSIKLRLKEEKYFRTEYIPRLDSLGYRILTILCYELDKSFDGENREEIHDLAKKILDYPENTYCIMSRKRAIIMNFSKDWSDYKRMQNVIDSMVHKLKLKFSIEKKIHIPLNNTNLFYYFNFAGILRNRFDSQILEDSYPDMILNEPVSLNKNEQKLIKGLIRYPEYTVNKLSEKINLSVPTICKIRKRFLDIGIIKLVNIPDFSKAGSELISFYYQKYVHSNPIPKCRDNNEFMTTRTNIENACISVHRDYTDMEKDIQTCSCDNNKDLLDSPFRMIIPIDDITYSKFDFEPLIDKIFKEG